MRTRRQAADAPSRPFGLLSGSYFFCRKDRVRLVLLGPVCWRDESNEFKKKGKIIPRNGPLAIFARAKWRSK